MARRAGHVFVSYKREEAGAARRLRDALEGAGFTTWWDVDIQTGQQWAQVLDTAVNGASAVVVLWSERAVRSPWVAHEASVALAHGTYVPARLELVAIVPPYDRVQATDLLDWDGDAEHAGFARLVDRLDHLMPLPTPLAARAARWAWRNVGAGLFVAALGLLVAVGAVAFQVLSRIEAEATKSDEQRLLEVVHRRPCEPGPGAGMAASRLHGIGGDLRGACLVQATLSRGQLRGAILEDADLRGASLAEADLGEAILSGAHLSAADLREADLREADLERADLVDADLTEADLTRADLSGADLSGADLSRARLVKANLGGADLRGADFTSADLSGARFLDATLRPTILEEARFEWAARLQEDAPIPGWDPRPCPSFREVGEGVVCLERSAR